MSVEFIADVGDVLYLGGDGEAHAGEAANLAQQRHQTITVVDVQLAITVVQLHQSTVRLKTTYDSQYYSLILENQNVSEKKCLKNMKHTKNSVPTFTILSCACTCTVHVHVSRKNNSSAEKRQRQLT